MSTDAGSVILKGIGVSPGVAIGPALLLERQLSPVPRLDLKPGRVASELERLEEASGRVRGDLARIEETADRELGASAAQIIDAQRLMLDDSSFVDPIRAHIRDQGHNAEWAVKETGARLAERFGQISDSYIRQRSNDVDDLTDRLLRSLAGEAPFRLDSLTIEVVLIASDLAPSDTAMLDRERVLGFATDSGSRTSHTAIMARSLNIPAVVGLHDAAEQIEDGDCVVIDGNEGRVIVRPSVTTLAEYRDKQAAHSDREEVLRRTSHLPARTPDGHPVRLYANIEAPVEAHVAREHGATGIGLYRSEFLHLQQPGSAPDEEDYYSEYRELLEAMSPHPVTIRTLDFGGEKEAPEDPTLHDASSLLGLRGVRRSLRDRETFAVQLRGLVRAGAHGELRVLLPFVTGVEELREVRAMMDEAREAARGQGHAVAERTPLGAMIEVPAAAMIVDQLADEAEFLSIGSNDLIQFLLAVDRRDDSVAHLYEPLHPAVLRLLREVVDAAARRSIPLSLCGEAASDPLVAMVYMGYRFEELSMAPRAIPVIKNVIRSVPLSEAERILQQAMLLTSGREVQEFALAELMAHFPDGLVVAGSDLRESNA